MNTKQKAVVDQRFAHYAFGMDVRNLTRGQLCETYAEVKAHAERLAEALKQACEEHDAIERPVSKWYLEGREALAQWEEAQK